MALVAPPAATAKRAKKLSARARAPEPPSTRRFAAGCRLEGPRGLCPELILCVTLQILHFLVLHVFVGLPALGQDDFDLVLHGHVFAIM